MRGEPPASVLTSHSPRALGDRRDDLMEGMETNREWGTGQGRGRESPCKHAHKGNNAGSRRKIKPRKKGVMKVTCRQSDEVRVSCWHKGPGQSQ